jgi:uncharacterized membrane protein (Fun14 family)
MQTLHLVGLFIAAVAYLEYQQIVSVDWNKIKIVLQNGITWVTNTITHISNKIGATHSGSHLSVPLTSSASVGLVLGLAKGSILACMRLDPIAIFSYVNFKLTMSFRLRV